MKTNILILLLILFTVYSLKMIKAIYNPAFIFNSIWLICFSLLKLNLSEKYTDNLSNKTFIMFFIFFSSFNIIYHLFSRIKSIRIKHVNLLLIKKRSKSKYIILIFKIWLFLTLIEVIYFRGIPLIWQTLGFGGSYATFGIPSLHGFINSLSWFILMISFIHYLDYKDKNCLRIILCITIIYIFLLARQSLITEVIQLTTIYLFKRKVNILKLITLVIIVIIGFGIVGNLRTDINQFLLSSGLKFEDIPIFFTGFIWAYMYITTPIVNIGSFIDSSFSLQMGKASIYQFFPSVILNIFNIEKIEVSEYLVSDTFNISTSLLTPYQDFGILGVLLFGSFLGFIGSQVWKKVQFKNSIREINLCNYSVYVGIILLTFFSNFLLSLPIVFQFVYINFLFRNYFSLNEK